MTDPSVSGRSQVLPASLTIGFGVALVMWVLGFILHLPALHIPGPVVAGALGAALVAGGFIAGRVAGVGAGFGSGLVAGLICLLIVLSTVADEEQTNALRPSWPVLIGGWLLACTVASGVAGILGAARSPTPRPALDWHARFAVIAAASVFPLIVIGGLVTGFEAGLAVPDWPNSFGSNMFLYPLSRMTGGIYYEHAHRLFGTLVGLTTLVFMIYTLVADRRVTIKITAIGMFILVCLQGGMGGLRVTDTNLALAMAHGVTAQIFFAGMCVLAAACSVRWKSREPARAAAIPGAPRRLATVLVALLIVQLIFGAMLRHLGPVKGAHAMMSHIANAVIVLIVLIGAGVRAPAAMPGDRLFKRLGKSTMHTGLLQFVLGGVALWAVLAYKDAEPPAGIEVLVTTKHQALGALLLAFAAMLLAWSRRLVLPRSAGVPTPARPATE